MYTVTDDWGRYHLRCDRCNARWHASEGPACYACEVQAEAEDDAAFKAERAAAKAAKAEATQPPRSDPRTRSSG